MTRYQDERRLLRVLDRVLAPDVVAIDGGARNGTTDLPRLARFVNVHGFEPSPAEYQRLLKRDKVSTVAYHAIHYSPYALLDKRGAATLYVNKRPGATSTLKPNVDFLRHFEADNWSQIREIVAEETVDGITLADYFSEQKIEFVDWMKLDTQGNELPILQGAGSMIDRISVIKVEVEMVPVYERQPLFGDVFNFLIQRGFEFVDLQSSRACRRYHTAGHFDRDAYRLVWGDALFVNNPFRFEAPRKLQQALILCELGYHDLGLYLLKNIPTLAAADKAVLIEEYGLPLAPVSNNAAKRWLKRWLPAGFLPAVRAYRQAKESSQVDLVR